MNLSVYGLIEQLTDR